MLPSDITVEVVDVNLQRQGQITPEDLDLEAKVIFRGVGNWKITLPREHEMAKELWKNGSGITIDVRGRRFLSGPTSKSSYSGSPEDPQGTIEFSGSCHNILLDDALAWPQPSNPTIGTQALSHDVRSGVAETVIRDYVRANIGQGAPAARRGKFAERLVVTSGLGLGREVSHKARFSKLIEVCEKLANLSRLGYRVVQEGTGLVFEVWSIRNREDYVRFDIVNGTLTEESIEKSVPGTTRPIVAGQGDLTARQLYQRTTPTSLAAEIATGRQIETFIDQRQTDVVKELLEAGDEALEESGFIATAVKAIPSDVESMIYGDDWYDGDRVAVLVDGQETLADITEVALVANSGGCEIAASIGDVRNFDPETALNYLVEDTAKRVRALERETTVGMVDVSRIPVNLLQVNLPEGQYVKAGGVRNELNGALTGRLAFYGASIRLEQSPWDSGSSNKAATLRVNANGVIDHNVDGGSYNPFPHAEAAGTVDLNATTGSTGVSTTVTLPGGRFDVPPLIQVSRANAAAATSRYAPYATGITTTTFTLGAVAADGSAANGLVRVAWYARQMTLTSAAG